MYPEIEPLALYVPLFNLLDSFACRIIDRAALASAFAEATYEGGVAAMLQADPKKQGKEKKPDANLVSLVFPDP